MSLTNFIVISLLATIGNANDDCYPQEDTFAKEAGLKNYSIFATVLFVVFIVLCFVFAISIYLFCFGFIAAEVESKPKLNEEEYASTLRKICKDSVYSYLVTDKPLGWLTAFATLGIQVGILGFFIIASEANLQNDKIDIEFTWKCPRDADVCDDKADLTNTGWAMFVLLMIAFLAKDFINGSKLLYHSSKVSHSGWSWRRFRCFLGGTSLFSITAFALYVSC